MGTLTQLQQNRRVIQDFTLRTLAAIPGAFARLTYMASLRDLSSGRYAHEGLLAVYQPESVQQALEQCHEEIFERLLESSLEAPDYLKELFCSNTRALLEILAVENCKAH
jgi:hypothetical protein